MPPRSRTAGEADAEADGERTISRPRIASRIAAAGPGSVVVAAPAGYGKTTAIDEWVEGRPDRPSVVVRLVPGDSARAVGERLDDALGGVLDGLLPRHDARWLGAALCRRVHQHLRTATIGALVLDGADGPASPTVVSQLVSLADHAPPDVTVVLAARAASHLSRLVRGDGRVELGAAELTFTPDEARDVVRRLAGVELSTDQLHEVMVHTWGWPIAVGLFARRLRHGDDVAECLETARRDPRLDAFVAYDVVGRLSERSKRFWRRAAVLPRLDAASCRAVTDEVAAGVLVRTGAASGLPCRSIPGSGGWQLHPIVRQHLRAELRRTDPPAYRDALLRAARWHRQRGAVQDSAESLIDAQAWEELADLVRAAARSGVGRPAAAGLVHSLDTAAATPAPAQSSIALGRAHLHTLLGDTHRAARVLAHLEGPGVPLGVAAARDALRASWVFLDAMPAPSIDAADRALSTLDRLRGTTSHPDMLDESTVRAMAETARARAHWCLGDAEQDRSHLVRVADDRGVAPGWRAQALGTLALWDAWDDRFDEAEIHALRALALAGRAGQHDHVSVVDARVALAAVAAERGRRVLGARQLWHAGNLQVAQVCGPATLIGVEDGLRLLTRSPRAGLRRVEALRGDGAYLHAPAVEARLDAAEAELRLAVGQTARARAILERPRRVHDQRLAALDVRVAAEAGDGDGARSALRRWCATVTEPSLPQDLWEAAVELDFGRRRHALVLGARAMRRAEAGAQVRVLVASGHAVHRLVLSVHTVSPRPFTARVLQLAAADADALQDTTGGLSARELDIVRYLATSQDGHEIAARLYISLNTLKTHQRVIYRKLGASNRRQAVDRACALGLA